MIANFSDAFRLLIGNEGGYSNNPADPGGETMYGITARVARKHGYMGAMKDLPLSTAQSIAMAEYWIPVGCDSYDLDLAFQVFDASYNSGQTQAALWLQRAVGATADGLVGPNTIKAVQAMPWAQVAFLFLAQRMQFYTDLGTWPTFGKGWARRIARNLSIAGGANV